MTVKTLLLDGKPVSAAEGQSLLDLCRENGVRLPTLCHLDGLGDVGACRLCLVEVKGSNKLLPACTTQAQEGMDVTTTSDRLRRYRRQIVELLFAERSHVCAICVANGTCELQSVARDAGLDHVRFEYQHPRTELDATHPRFILDHARCILCTRCVRVCDEIEGAHTWDVGGRGDRLPRHHRHGPALGPGRQLHQLRQVPPRLPHRGALREGARRRGHPQGPRVPHLHQERTGEETVEPMTLRLRRRCAAATLREYGRLGHRRAAATLRECGR